MHDADSKLGVWQETATRFECRDRVRTYNNRSEMTVVLATDDRVHCEWFVGTQLQLGWFPASALRLVQRAKQ
jgi:hypothetical protein